MNGTVTFRWEFDNPEPCKMCGTPGQTIFVKRMDFTGLLLVSAKRVSTNYNLVNTYLCQDCWEALCISASPIAIR